MSAALPSPADCCSTCPPSECGTPINLSSVISQIIDGLLSFTNVKSYGATGDGTTDDSDAIQDAFDALQPGGSLFFPNGRYKINQELKINKTNVRIFGSGAGRGIIDFTAPDPFYTRGECAVLDFKDNPDSCCLRLLGNDIIWDGPAIFGNGNTTSDYAVMVDGTHQGIGGGTSVIRENTILNTMIGWFNKPKAIGIWDSGWMTEVRNCYVTNMVDGAGIRITAMGSLAASTTHTFIKTMVQYCECAVDTSGDTLGIEFRDCLFTFNRIIGGIGAQSFVAFRNCQFEGPGYDIGGSNGFKSDQFVNVILGGANFYEGPFYVYAGKLEFDGCVFLYTYASIDPTCNGTTGAGWVQKGWIVSQYSPSAYNSYCQIRIENGINIYPDHAIFRHQDVAGQLVLEECLGWNISDFRVCEYACGHPALGFASAFGGSIDWTECKRSRQIYTWGYPATQFSVGVRGVFEAYDELISFSTVDAAPGTPPVSKIVQTPGWLTAGDSFTASTTAGSDVVRFSSGVPVGAVLTIAGVAGTKTVISMPGAYGSFDRIIDVAANATVNAAAVTPVAPTFY